MYLVRGGRWPRMAGDKNVWGVESRYVLKSDSVDGLLNKTGDVEERNQW